MAIPDKMVVLLDFDDTSADQNVAELLLRKFGKHGWLGVREKFRRGDTSLRNYQEEAFRCVEASHREMGDFVGAEASVRSGLVELVDYCFANGIQVAIVSNGLVFYIQALLNQYQVLKDLPVFAVETSNEGTSVEFGYPYATDTCFEWGNCKCKVLNLYRDLGYKIVYFGDGTSDLCPSRLADYVYARSSLLEHCLQEHIPCRAFNSFLEPLNDLQEGSFRENWEREFGEVEHLLGGNESDQ